MSLLPWPSVIVCTCSMLYIRPILLLLFIPLGLVRCLLDLSMVQGLSLRVASHLCNRSYFGCLGFLSDTMLGTDLSGSCLKPLPQSVFMVAFVDSAARNDRVTTEVATDEPQAPVLKVSAHILVDQAFFVTSSEVGRSRVRQVSADYSILHAA